MRSRLAIFTLAVAVPLAACGGDDGVGLSGDPLTDAEAQALAQVVMSQGLEASQEAEAAASAARTAGTSGASVPIEYDVDVTAPCPLGGTYNVAGSLDGDVTFVDAEIQTLDATYSLQHNHSGCGVPVQIDGSEVDFTLDGRPDVTHTYDISVDAGSSLELSGIIQGAVDWATGDGRSGTCPIDFTIDVSGFSLSETTGSLSVAVDGVVCGVSISESLTVEPETTT